MGLIIANKFVIMDGFSQCDIFLIIIFILILILLHPSFHCAATTTNTPSLFIVIIISVLFVVSIMSILMVLARIGQLEPGRSTCSCPAVARRWGCPAGSNQPLARQCATNGERRALARAAAHQRLQSSCLKDPASLPSLSVELAFG